MASLNGHITKAHCGATKEIDEITNVLEQLKELEKQTTNTTLSNITNKTATDKSSIANTLSGKEPAVDSGKALEVRREETRNNEQSCQDVENNDVSYIRLADSSIDGIIRHYEVLQRKAGDVRWYICSYCSKEFKKPSDLIRHIRVHTREKPYEVRLL